LLGSDTSVGASGHQVGGRFYGAAPSTCPYSAECVEVEFCEVRRHGVLRSTCIPGSLPIIPAGCILAPLGQAIRTGDMGYSPMAPRKSLRLATAVHIVVLVSKVVVFAFAAIEPVPLPILGGKRIVVMAAIEDILSLV
jgi:hypothetical protein